MAATAKQFEVRVWLRHLPLQQTLRHTWVPVKIYSQTPIPNHTSLQITNSMSER